MWTEDSTVAWIEGEVLSIRDEQAHIQTSTGETVSRTLQHSLCCLGAQLFNQLTAFTFRHDMKLTLMLSFKMQSLRIFDWF